MRSVPAIAIASQGVTGVMGAELVDGKPVPVVRVPDSTKDGIPGCVKYVTPGGVGIGSWTNCYSSIQSAISAAGGCEIWVAAGTYSENIMLSTGTKIYGGFVGGETLRDERNWALHETVLDGGAYSVVYMGTNSRLDGFTVQNGSGGYGTSGGICADTVTGFEIVNNRITGNYNGDPINTGVNSAGIYCKSCSGQIYNNVITGNTAYSDGGGGIGCEGDSTEIIGNVISDNTSYSGGGIACSS
ncbi:MAG: hypothetical protein ABFD54_14310, partial [Armatimonadota bacterium]